MSFQRARRPEQVQERREALLVAAKDLGLAQGVARVTLGDLGARVGLSKSNVLRHAGTKEALYAELALAGWTAWEARLRGRLEGRQVGVVEAAAALAGTLAEEPLLCQLLGQPLEHNVSGPALRRHRLGVVRVVGELGALLSRAVADFTPEDGAEVIGLATALAAATWAQAHPPPALARLHAEEPGLAGSAVAFEPRLRQLLITVLTGVRTLRRVVRRKGPVAVP